jgi:hypothetical protein
MAYAIEVNGNRVHDEGEHEPGPDKHVLRSGGGSLVFETEADAEKACQALYESTVASWSEDRVRRRFPMPPRSAFVVVDLARAYEPPRLTEVSSDDPRARAMAEELGLDDASVAKAAAKGEEKEEAVSEPSRT